MIHFLITDVVAIIFQRRIMVFDDGRSNFVHMLKTSISSENCVIIKMLTLLVDTWKQVLTHFLSMASNRRRGISSKNSLLFMFSESLHSIEKHGATSQRRELLADAEVKLVRNRNQRNLKFSSSYIFLA